MVAQEEDREGRHAAKDRLVEGHPDHVATEGRGPVELTEERAYGSRRPLRPLWRPPQDRDPHQAEAPSQPEEGREAPGRGPEPERAADEERDQEEMPKGPQDAEEAPGLGPRHVAVEERPPGRAPAHQGQRGDPQARPCHLPAPGRVQALEPPEPQERERGRARQSLGRDQEPALAEPIDEPQAEELEEGRETAQGGEGAYSPRTGAEGHERLGREVPHEGHAVGHGEGVAGQRQAPPPPLLLRGELRRRLALGRRKRWEEGHAGG